MMVKGTGKIDCKREMKIVRKFVERTHMLFSVNHTAVHRVRRTTLAYIEW